MTLTMMATVAGILRLNLVVYSSGVKLPMTHTGAQTGDCSGYVDAGRRVTQATTNDQRDSQL